MAKFDLTSKMTKYLDRHLVAPLLEFLWAKKVIFDPLVLSRRRANVVLRPRTVSVVVFDPFRRTATGSKDPETDRRDSRPRKSSTRPETSLRVDTQLFFFFFLFCPPSTIASDGLNGVGLSPFVRR